MKFTTLLVSLPLLTLTAAAPSWVNWGPPKCMSRSVGEEIVQQFGTLLSAFNAQTAANLLSPTNFTDTSDSINFLAGIPLGSVTFPSQGAFIGGQGTQPPIGFTLLAVDSVSCDGVITFRWSANVGGPLPVKGINVLYTALAAGGDIKAVGAGGWQITRVFSEFNSAAWVVDIGGTCAVPQRSMF